MSAARRMARRWLGPLSLAAWLAAGGFTAAAQDTPGASVTEDTPGAAAIEAAPGAAAMEAISEALGTPAERTEAIDDPDLGPLWRASARDADGRSLTVVVSEDGTVHHLVREVDRDAVPAIVLTKVDVALEGFAATSYHAKEIDGAVSVYILEGTADGLLYEVTVDPGGDDLTIAGAT